VALESGVLGNLPARFGEGRLEKGQQRYLAGRLLHFGRAKLDLLRQRVLNAA
jgi:hypothetical protein